jgi:ribosomal protein S18 acetylase RimI-like enzyme
VIDPAFRNMGFGSMLLNEAIKFSVERNRLRVTLLTDYDNEIAIHFYERFKFSKSPMIPMRLVF